MVEVKTVSIRSVIVNSHHPNTFHLRACLQQVGHACTTIASGYTYKWPHGAPFHQSSAQQMNLASSLRMEHLCQSVQARLQHHQQFTTIYHLPSGFLSLRNEEPLPGLSPQTPVSGYYWPGRTQVADKAVSPSCFRSSLSSCPFSWCPLCHSFCPYVVFESCNVSRPSMYSLLDNVYDIIYTCLMSYPGITFVVA